MRGRPDANRLAQGSGFAMLIKLALLTAIYCVIVLFPRVFWPTASKDAEPAEAASV